MERKRGKIKEKTNERRLMRVRKGQKTRIGKGKGGE